MNDSVLLTLAGSKRLRVEKIREITALSAQALNDCIAQLNAVGANIDNNDGYLHWPEPFECLSPSVIEAAVERDDCKVSVFDSTTSTNALLAAEQSVHGRAILAEHQSAGVGRRGKPWLSPLGKNLYISCGWSIHSTQLFAALSLTIGVSIAGALRDFGCADVGLKWPNDLYIKGRKVGGLLIDSVTCGKDAQLVLGLGINIFKQDFPEDLEVPATTLVDEYPELEKTLNRNDLAARLINAVFQELSAITRYEPNSLASWSAYDVSYNREVRVLRGNEVITGIAKGITADGEFILAVDDGIATFSQAEVSLRI